ncbi:SDR family oxidoreductase [Salinibaculum rarum]|uniref:SDR family oxidoreductase n=1 Tax=Salinibaculum rarum TaxID=3058903 RepID=UPI00265D9D56|nr:SDR family oxidoreductase [Salinibaculum sp. KK48]
MTAFLTGFPGFLGVSLTERLLERGETVTCLVQPKYHDTAGERAEELRHSTGVASERLTLVTGDITDPNLGLDDPETVREQTSELYHLAAIYDLGVDRAPAEAVNVGGTERVLDFTMQAGVERLHYVSTCYVSGRHDGVFGPDDLDVGQSFNNHYEATKFEAEVAVQERMDDGLPATIYRPAIAVGDSQTGETAKYDGLYYLLRLFDRQPRIAVGPIHPPSRRYEFNVVPRDFVVDAIAELSGRAETAGSVFQLCNPNPPTVRQLLALCVEALGRRIVPVPVHAGATRRLLERFDWLARALDVEPATMDYLAHPTRYVSPNTQRALAETDISCPPLSAYLDTLVAYMRAHPEVSADAMV